MKYEKWPSWWLLLAYIGTDCVYADEKYNAIHRDGSFEFSYDTPDAFHVANGDRNNVVRGEFGGRNPKTGLIDKTTYTAGPRGYRPRGKNIARKYDLSQIGPRPVGSKDDPYFDPYEDPSYNFAFKTRTYSREENANRYGDVKGSYTYLDDVGERHNVEFIAGKRTGFHVKTPFPDSNPNAYGPLFFNGRGKPIPRGRTAIQRGLDGSYRFISAGPDQRRTETSDASGHVRGSYTYLDDKGVQHSVHYIAGPETGYRVLKNVKGPHLPTIYPFSRPNIIPPDYYDSFDKAEKELFDTAASGRPRPSGASRPSNTDDNGGGDSFDDDKGTDYGGDREAGISTSRPQYSGGKRPSGSAGRPKPPKPPIDEYDDGGEDIDLFGGGESATGSTAKPSGQAGGTNGETDRKSEEESFNAGNNRPSNGATKPNKDETNYDDGAYKPSEDDGAYKPSEGEGSYRPSGGRRPTRPRPPTSQKPQTPGGTGSSRPSGDGISSTPSSSGGFQNSDSNEYRPSGEGNYKPSTKPSDEYQPSGEENGGSYGTSASPGGFSGEEGTVGYEGGQGSTVRPNTGYGDREGSTVRPGISGKPASTGSRPGRPEGGSGISTYRPSRPIRPRPTRPPFGNRPTYGSGNRAKPKPDTGFNEQEEDEDFNLFGSESSGPVSRPSSTTIRPSGGDSFLESDDSAGSFDENEDKTRPQNRPSAGQRPNRPTSRPESGQFGGSGSNSDFGGQRPRPTPDSTISEQSGGTSTSRPDYGPSSSGGGESDGSGYSPGGYNKPGVIGISSGGDSLFERGTIVTNLGDKVFSVPPGVSVRAHVQAIDLLPLDSRIPSPSEQYRAETTIQSEQYVEASEKISVSTQPSRNTSNGTTYDEEDIFK